MQSVLKLTLNRIHSSFSLYLAKMHCGIHSLLYELLLQQDSIRTHRRTGGNEEGTEIQSLTEQDLKKSTDRSMERTKKT